MQALSTLEALRPRLDQAPVRTSESSTAALAEILDRAMREQSTPLPHPRRTRRRVRALTAACLALALALLVAPVAGDRHRPGLSAAQAATLQRLATQAEQQPTDLARAGQYRYFRIRETGTAETAAGTVTHGTSYREQWVAADGTVWRRDTHHTGRIERYRFAPDTGSGGGSYSPAYLAGLPIDPQSLYEHLRTHARGSSSRDEAVFVAVGDMLRTEMASPALRSAAINALGFLPVDVATGARSATGAIGVLISMNRPRGQGTQAILVDERSSAVIEQRGSARYDRPVDPHTSRSLTYTGTVIATRLVDSLPADLQSLG